MGSHSGWVGRDLRDHELRDPPKFGLGETLKTTKLREPTAVGMGWDQLGRYGVGQVFVFCIWDLGSPPHSRRKRCGRGRTTPSAPPADPPHPTRRRCDPDRCRRATAAWGCRTGPRCQGTAGRAVCRNGSQWDRSLGPRGIPTSVLNGIPTPIPN